MAERASMTPRTLILKSSRTVQRSGVSLIQPLLQCFIDDQITVNRPRPPVMPDAAWCSVPASFWNSFSEILFVLVRFLSVCCLFTTFVGGSWTVKFAPLINQPRNSFACWQRPLSLSSFASEIRSPPLCFVTLVGGKTCVFHAALLGRATECGLWRCCRCTQWNHQQRPQGGSLLLSGHAMVGFQSWLEASFFLCGGE